MTGELMRQVAALDVTRMSCEQITEWFASEDTAGKMQHRVLGVNGKDLLRALHEAPEDVADWLDPTTCGEGKIQERIKDERFKSLREGLVRTLAESSGKLAEIEALKLARKINHHKQVWSATWKLVARGCCHGVMELRCLVRTLLYRLRINGPSVSLDDLSVFADYARFLLVPSQVYDVTGTALAKTLSGSLELILKNKNNKTATALGSEATERCLQSFVGVLCALCPYPSGDSRDTASTSEAGRRLGDVCIVSLPVLCPGLGRYQLVRRDQTVRWLGIERAETETTRTTTNKLRSFQDYPIPTEATHTKCVMASFLAKLSWHDDNKIQMYQAAEEVIPRVLLAWLCDIGMKDLAQGDKYVASARLNMATVIWNLSKRADNAAGLVQPETFDMLFYLLGQKEEEGDVLRRIVSCIQNLASMRRCASDLTDYIASDPSVSNFLGTLFGLLARGSAKNMHQRVMGTFANLAYLCVAGGASTEWAGHLRESLKQFLLHFTETSDVLGNFNLDPLEAQDRQLKFQGVRFEVVDLLQCIATPSERYASDGSGGEGGHGYDTAVASEHSGRSFGGQERAVDASEQMRADTVRTFALWILAHYTGRSDDRVHVASHGGLTVLTSILMGPTGLVEAAKAGGASGGKPASKQSFINLKLAAKALANLCQAPQNAELVEPAGALAAIKALYAYISDNNDIVGNTSASTQPSTSSAYGRAQMNCIPARYKIDPDFRKAYLVIQENLWRPVVKDPVVHEDGSLTVHYEVPAGNNECFELSKKLTPLMVERKELQICQGEVPHQINVFAEVAACLSALAMHSSVLKLFAPSGVLGPFLELSLEQLVPRETCLTALLDTPVKAYSQHAQVMRHLWSLITSTVLDSETDAPESEGDDTEGNFGEDAVVQEGDGIDVSGEGAGDPTVEPKAERRRQSDAETASWSSRIVQKKLEQALAVRVLDRLVAGADEDAFEPAQSSSTRGDGSWGSDKIGEQDSQQPGGGKGLSFDEGAKSKRRRSSGASAPLSVLDVGRRTSAEFRRQSLLMTSGRAYTVSGILSQQVLLSGIIVLASPTDESKDKWRRVLSASLAAPVLSAQRRLEYFCIGLAGSVSDAVRRNWLALDGNRTNARNAMKALMELCVDHMAVLVNKAELASFQNRPDTETVATTEPSALSPLATQRNSNNSAEEKSPRARPQRESLTDPPEKPDTKSSPKRGLGLSINPDVGKCRGDEIGGGGGGCGFDGGMTAAGVGGDDRRHGREQPALFRQERSFDSAGAISALSGMSGLGVGGGAETRGGIEAFLLPEEEQVVQMLFRAILSLLSVKEECTTAEDSRLGDGSENPRRQQSRTVGKNRWGSFRGRERQSRLGVEAAGDSAGGAEGRGDDTSRPPAGAAGRLDDILRLCCRLLRCGPGDGVLHVSLQAIGKVSAAGGGGAPSAANTPDGKPGTRRSFTRQSSSEWDSEASLDMDGDFDVRQRSEDGCIPPLLAMVRSGGCNTERGAASMEQEVALCVLQDLASANNLCREAIVCHGGVPVLLQAPENYSARARRAVADRGTRTNESKQNWP
ncbi:hypothetical protein Esi_0004_0241 [Ectocarpus siliculosus]|uniref:Uncharacterized protein n=1 Tax=Ectocarpus siliculosus TaxID=2880 RepID=D8LMJ2_ECTSI|nr:hypothetical protein Esi_0004_0241 [Ectocarpus siliculosus]|eukprot:CBN77602.1 hypothetical protein Esi_0004_0241 [Ectocarpus siliculosus]